MLAVTDSQLEKAMEDKDKPGPGAASLLRRAATVHSAAVSPATAASAAAAVAPAQAGNLRSILLAMFARIAALDPLEAALRDPAGPADAPLGAAQTALLTLEAALEEARERVQAALGAASALLGGGGNMSAKVGGRAAPGPAQVQQWGTDLGEGEAGGGAQWGSGAAGAGPRAHGASALRLAGPEPARLAPPPGGDALLASVLAGAPPVVALGSPEQVSVPGRLELALPPIGRLT